MSLDAQEAEPQAAVAYRRPRLGFLGVGWIGRHRMQAMLQAGTVEVVAIAEPSRAAVDDALSLAPGAIRAGGLKELLQLDLDGLVIATPNALHAEQCILALERGLAVFCQKPLGRTMGETKAVVEAARAADRLLGVDFSYRRTKAMTAIRDLVRDGELGEVFALDLVFHNAYGPNKPWFYDARRSGGGCVIDLGVHLVDLALWLLDFPPVRAVGSSLYAGGRRLAPIMADQVEDYAVASIEFETGVVARLACSWTLHAGCDAVISAAVHGSEGGATMRNVDGSFYDFIAERYKGSERSILASPPDDWGGRAACAWAQRLAKSARFDPTAEQLVTVAQTIDRLYGRAP